MTGRTGRDALTTQRFGEFKNQESSECKSASFNNNKSRNLSSVCQEVSKNPWGQRWGQRGRHCHPGRFASVSSRRTSTSRGGTSMSFTCLTNSFCQVSEHQAELKLSCIHTKGCFGDKFQRHELEKDIYRCRPLIHVSEICL